MKTFKAILIIVFGLFLAFLSLANILGAADSGTYSDSMVAFWCLLTPVYFFVSFYFLLRKKPEAVSNTNVLSNVTQAAPDKEKKINVLILLVIFFVVRTLLIFLFQLIFHSIPPNGGILNSFIVTPIIAGIILAASYNSKNKEKQKSTFIIILILSIAWYSAFQAYQYFNERQIPTSNYPTYPTGVTR